MYQNGVSASVGGWNLMRGKPKIARAPIFIKISIRKPKVQLIVSDAAAI